MMAVDVKYLLFSLYRRLNPSPHRAEVGGRTACDATDFPASSLTHSLPERRIFLLLPLLFLTACGGGSSGYSPHGGTDRPTAVKLGKPYRVKGQHYVPRHEPDYRESGIASWYGPGFNGRMTASGEKFDENEVTGAHRTLPMPSIVQVKNLDNGRTALVRINDRGPFAHSRIIDVSKGAARELGMLRSGTARVEVTYRPQETDEYIADLGLQRPAWLGPTNVDRHTVQPAETRVAGVGVRDLPSLTVSASGLGSKPQAREPVASPFLTGPSAPRLDVALHTDTNASPPPVRAAYRVQAGSFGSAGNADRLAERMRSFSPVQVEQIMVKDKPYYRVLLGPVRRVEEAESIVRQVAQAGIHDARILVD